MAETPTCRSCGATALRDLGPCAPFPAHLELPERIRRMDPGRLLRCLHCGLGQRHPTLDEASLAELYRAAPSEAMEYPFEQNVAWATARRLLLERLGTGAGLQVLDIGCHTGGFLAGLPSAWGRFGIEGGEAPSRVARDERGITIIADRLDTVGESWRARFDAVTLFDVLEHLADPLEGIAQAGCLLKPGGLLLVSSGDMDAWTWKFTAGRHWYLQTPLHLSFVSPAFIGYAAAKCQLQVQAVRRIPHRQGTLSTRVREAVETIYWEWRQRGGWYRLPQRLIQSMPGFGYLRHRQTVPWTMRLRDHTLAMLGQTAT